MNHRNRHISYIRAVSSLGIVLLHTFAICMVAFYGQMTRKEEFVFGLPQYLMMWCVPCFVMVTGALLLDEGRQADYKRMFGRYIPRILIVLFLSVAAFAVIDAWMNHDGLSPSLIKVIFKKFYTRSSWSHLWYLYMLIGLYLLIPVIKRFVLNSSLKECLVFVLIMLFFFSVLPLIDKISGVKAGFSLAVNSIYPVYLMLGHLIFSGKLKIRRKTGLALTFTGLVLVIFLYYYAVYHAGTKWKNDLTDYLGSYAFLPVVLFSVGVFSLAMSSEAQASQGENRKGKTLQQKKDTSTEKGGTEVREGATALSGIVSRFLMSVDDCSFGIYLIHLAFLRYVFKCTDFDPLKRGGFLMMLLLTFAVFILSYVIVLLYRTGKQRIRRKTVSEKPAE